MPSLEWFITITLIWSCKNFTYWTASSSIVLISTCQVKINTQLWDSNTNIVRYIYIWSCGIGLTFVPFGTRLCKILNLSLILSLLFWKKVKIIYNWVPNNFLFQCVGKRKKQRSGLGGPNLRFTIIYNLQLSTVILIEISFYYIMVLTFFYLSFLILFIIIFSVPKQQ